MSLPPSLEAPTERPWQPRGEGVVRFAVVGVGWWTREYALPALAAATHTTPTMLVTGSPRTASDLRASYPTVERVVTYEAFADGVGAAAYDAAYVATPNGTHLEHVRAAAANGADVLCEKPLETTPARAEDLVAAVREAGRRLMVGYRMQADPTVRRLRTLVREGVLGDPVQAHAHMSQRLLDFIGADTWRLDPDLVGRGASVTDLGVYPINTLRFLLDADPVSVVASGESTHPAFDSVPDERASFELTFEDGTRASCSVSQHAQLTGWLDVVGTEGSVELTPAFFGDDEQSLRLSLGSDVHRVSYTPPDQMRELFALFADRVLTGAPVVADGAHALVDVSTTDAVYDAIDSGERERVAGRHRGC